MKLAGIDLAWQSDKNPSAIAIGKLKGGSLNLQSMYPAIYGIERVIEQLNSETDLSGMAIDAPLIIENIKGQRPCEKLLSSEYGSRFASCHTSNLTLYPGAKSVYLSESLHLKGFNHLSGNKWQIECYPHPAIIEIFGLSERLKYKKGKVSDKKFGQIQLASLIKSLEYSSVLKLKVDENFNDILDEKVIESLRGQSLKSNEDALDSIVCLYIAGLFAVGAKGKIFGYADSGYIWVPQLSCVN